MLASLNSKAIADALSEHDIVSEFVQYRKDKSKADGSWAVYVGDWPVRNFKSNVMPAVYIAKLRINIRRILAENDRRKEGKQSC